MKISIRVLHLGKYFPPAPGGIETHLQTIALAQASLGVAVSVFCMEHRGLPTSFSMDGPVKIHRFKPDHVLYKLEWSSDLRKALHRPDADILHLHVPNPTMILALQLAKPRIPIIVTYHSDVVRQKILGILFRPIERLVFGRVKIIFTTSPNYAAGSKFLQLYKNKIHVLPLGLNLAPYLAPTDRDLIRVAEIREKYKSPIWLSCGRMVYYKGLQNAVKALVKVPGSLVLIGEGPEQKRIENLANQMHVSERVHFVGRLPEIHNLIPFYHAAEALWFPSNERSEAFGLVQVEAMACGCPVINTQIPASGVPWVSRNEESGLTVPINDPDALAAAAMRLLKCPNERRSFSQGAVKRAKSYFSDGPMAIESIRIYQEVLGK
jgi:rhamnosyl/mannosyltransferase